MGWDRRWEGGSRWRGYLYTCDRFMLMYDRKKHNIVKQLSSNKTFFKKRTEDSHGGPVVKNLPANAGDMGPIPSQGRFDMPQGSWAHEPQLLSQRSRARRLQLLKPTCAGTHALQQEKPLQWEAPAPSMESSPYLLQLEKAPVQQWRLSTAKNK